MQQSHDTPAVDAGESWYCATEELIWIGNLGTAIIFFTSSISEKFKNRKKKPVTVLKFVMLLFKFLRDRWLIWLNQPLFTLELIHWSYAKKYRLNSPHYFRLHINSRIAKFQKNKGVISTVPLRTETSEWIISVSF